MSVVLFFKINWKRLILRKKYCYNKSDQNCQHRVSHDGGRKEQILNLTEKSELIIVCVKKLSLSKGIIRVQKH